ncbi:MAG TPA: hypothetical protein PK833_03515 [Vicingus sp.]|nr:hypothetical protein [Vicingus sp.]
MIKQQLFIRDIQYKNVFESFFISSIAAILGIRFFLILTKYPQLSGGGLHISHMLWGGLLMFIALLLLLTLISNDVKKFAAIIGGIGFGTFIDELGKFITSDNNYFYQPTFALIYIFFVLIYLLFRFIENRHEFTAKEYVANSIEIMKDAVIHNLDSNEKAMALSYLAKGNTKEKISQTLRSIYEEIQTIQPPPPNFFTKLTLFFQEKYFSVITLPWFKYVVIIFFLIQGLLSMTIVVLITIEGHLDIIPNVIIPHSFTQQSYNLVNVVSALLAIIFVLIGSARIFVSRLSAYIMFKRSILISICLTQIFVFYYSPMRAISTLIFHIIILITLNYLIQAEINMKSISKAK